ncbi:Guanine nucleotide exchange factor synembryn [Popillia japonica]|uniref:Guanine nucleotide exchange factor synembryn n=1 Tax=Popillia japonica TaxID=7064 RepID=A0AAW1LAN6_POPJA
MKSKISAALENYAQEISCKFSFPELDIDDYRNKLFKAFHCILKDEELQTCHKVCLQIIRILSREKKDLNEVMTPEFFNIILRHSGLKDDKDMLDVENYDIALEALMCLCNITFNATIPRQICCRNGTVESILKRLNILKNVFPDIHFFDMKILFIITALCENIRAPLKDEMHGLRYLIEYLESMLTKFKQSNHNADVRQEPNKLPIIYTNTTFEILKTLFNLTLRSKNQAIMEEEEECHYLRLVTVLHDLLLVETEEKDKKLELTGHIIHLLLNMPDYCLKPLIRPIEDDVEAAPEITYERYNMSALHEILRYLKSRFTPELTVNTQNESLSPVLTATTKLAKSNRIIRKYFRQQVLPPLRDIHTRPEQGDTIRNCLCRLLTSPITQVRDLAADFIFVLCKENVGRMIKYTGYGNAAGMFATRGLLNGDNGETQNYSSASEDSETEEYNEYKHGINPVTGCYQEPKPSPTANMTEEQKEYEAMKLVELMNNLTRKGIVKPCRIGPDGKPEPIEHVLQLQEGLGRQSSNINDSGKPEPIEHVLQLQEGLGRQSSNINDSDED